MLFQPSLKLNAYLSITAVEQRACSNPVASSKVSGQLRPAREADRFVNSPRAASLAANPDTARWEDISALYFTYPSRPGSHMDSCGI